MLFLKGSRSLFKGITFFEGEICLFYEPSKITNHSLIMIPTPFALMCGPCATLTPRGLARSECHRGQKIKPPGIIAVRCCKQERISAWRLIDEQRLTKQETRSHLLLHTVFYAGARRMKCANQGQVPARMKCCGCDDVSYNIVLKNLVYSTNLGLRTDLASDQHYPAPRLL